MTEKVIRDGMVAVLYSPGYGAGWHTWNEGVDVFDAEMVAAIDDKPTLYAIAKRKYPDAYDGELRDLKIFWVPQGARFEIHEYDGSESVRVLGPNDGFVA